MAKKSKKQTTTPLLDRMTNSVSTWIGSTASLVLHTVFFAVIFVLVLFGLSLDTVLLVLTTVVSLEAIYLAIFIQRSVNQQSATIAGEFDQLEEAISEDIDETEAALMKDLDETEKNISEDIDESEAEISKDIDETEQDLEKPLDEMVSQLRSVIREEIERALKESKK